jgi:lycopene beta-cyclase
MVTVAPRSFDYVLVGGGLGNALIALAVFDAQPEARVALIERESQIGGNHVWCFHEGDVGERQSYVSPLQSATWPRYEVRFPNLQRTLDQPYTAVRSEQLALVVEAAFRQRPESQLLLSSRAERCTANRVTLDDGTELSGKVVIESRGPEAFAPQAALGYQKFLGLELKLRRPSPVAHPVLMDALVPQRDGFRFMYALPFSADRVLLEDTYFSDSSELDRERLEREILQYAEKNGFFVDSVERREVGVLPLPTRLPQLQEPADDEPLVAGYQGGWFHPVTGYSFPVAARVASAVASTDPAELRRQVWPRLQRAQRAQLRFCVLLNRMFFEAFAPDARRHVIERFYGLEPGLVRRFYALELSHVDRARILCGRPPRGFSLSRALSRGHSPSAPSRTIGGALS